MQTNSLREYVGRTKTERDVAVPSQAQAMAALLDRDPALFSTSVALPEFWHWIYFRPAVQRSRLGEDGHELRGEFLPPVQLPRRMWAGGRLKFLKSITIGENIERTTKIVSIDEKKGDSGKLVLVTVRYLISGSDGPCVEEEQDVIYCEIPRGNQSSNQPQSLPKDVEWTDSFQPDAVTLFRYSALMFNAHRIHYDYPFTTEIEGYRGLLVHGPLTALLLLETAKLHSRQVPASYEYRGVAPLFSDEPITLAGRNNDDKTSVEVWAAGPTAEIAMKARVTWQA